MEIETVDTDIVAEQGQKLYEEILRAKLEPDYRGKVVAIDPDSEEYFIGDSVVEAIQKGREKHPDALFYLVRVGYRAVHVHR